MSLSTVLNNLLFTGADVNIAGTMDNEQPLVTAVKSSSARCVKEILQMYPKQLHAQVRQGILLCTIQTL